MTLLQPANEKQLRRYLAEKCPAPRSDESRAADGEFATSPPPQGRMQRRSVAAPTRRSENDHGDADSAAAGTMWEGGISARPVRAAATEPPRSISDKLAAPAGDGSVGRGRDRQRGRDRSIPAGRDAPFAMDGDGLGLGGDADVGDGEVDMAVLAKHVKAMRKYFKAYIKSQASRQVGK
jgi:hypothetical protein